MKKEKAWVWFKGGQKGGAWEAGFLASATDQEGILLVERTDFISCRLPQWRVRLSAPEDDKKSPLIPKDAIWKYR